MPICPCVKERSELGGTSLPEAVTEPRIEELVAVLLLGLPAPGPNGFKSVDMPGDNVVPVVEVTLEIGYIGVGPPPKDLPEGSRLILLCALDIIVALVPVVPNIYCLFVYLFLKNTVLTIINLVAIF